MSEEEEEVELLDLHALILLENKCREMKRTVYATLPSFLFLTSPEFFDCYWISYGCIRKPLESLRRKKSIPFQLLFYLAFDV